MEPPVKLWCYHQASLQVCFQLAGRHEQPANHTVIDSLLPHQKPKLEAAQRSLAHQFMQARKCWLYQAGGILPTSESQGLEQLRHMRTLERRQGLTYSTGRKGE